MYDNIKTVIFDMDGVLLDSENLDMKIWIELADRYGIKDILQAFYECVGTPDSNIIRVLDRYISESGLRIPADITGEEFRKKTFECMDKYAEEFGMPRKFFAEECLESLKKKGYRLGLASSTAIDRVRSQMTDTDLIGYFDDIVGGGMFKKGKPDPEIFLMSCDRLGGKPSETAVIEDSFNGIRAAFSAGMRPIMVPDVIRPNDEMRRKAWKILSNLKEVSDML